MKQNILIAVAPIVGTTRTASAALEDHQGVGIAILTLEDELEAEEDAQ